MTFGLSNKKLFQLTSGICEVFLERSGRKIWENCEPSDFPFIPCYTRDKILKEF